MKRKYLPYWQSPDKMITLYHGDCREIMPSLAGTVDVVCTDPPYLLSNDGLTVSGGHHVSVNKGDWDRSQGVEHDHTFHRSWVVECRVALKTDGTLWASGTHHAIYSIGFALQRQMFRVLNHVTWVKPAPPPNLACRSFTHSTEAVVWAAHSHKSKYHFNYEEMVKINGGKQMLDVWKMSPPGKAETRHGKHPTQKPIRLVDRMLAASASVDDLVLDPFNGGGTTAVVCVRRKLRYVGIELEIEHLDLTIARLKDERIAWGLAVRKRHE